MMHVSSIVSSHTCMLPFVRTERTYTRDQFSNLPHSMHIFIPILPLLSSPLPLSSASSIHLPNILLTSMTCATRFLFNKRSPSPCTTSAHYYTHPTHHTSVCSTLNADVLAMVSCPMAVSSALFCTVLFLPVFLFFLHFICPPFIYSNRRHLLFFSVIFFVFHALLQPIIIRHEVSSPFER